ncbi:hypothetical protein MSAS_49310 [Mycobacterium saskatchewanense]|uniref:hypothetical protein n=1 Tax=Mycobacterium saskatchewanense TaxID=220927 RepID=UPI0013021D4E|nr:hypothetical protein [Mycobacterium saskatchewanense]BBX65757.1 hypothetical protein MSAS_49310 [Mycobacterium saskatchewanense]
MGELLADRADDPIAQVVRERPEFREFAGKYGLTYGSSGWCDDIVQRYGLNPPIH